MSRLIRRPLGALLRRSHRYEGTRRRTTASAVDRIVCRHGLTRCDHCRPLYQTGVAARNALMTPTRLMPTLDARR